MTTATVTSQHHPTMAARFTSDITKHQMTVARDDGLYRHLRFRAPDTGMYWFDLLTWPGVLCVNGDMGTYVFARLEDMFTFFRTGTGDINPGYWAEKVQAAGPGIKEYSSDLFVQTVRDYVADHVRDEGEPEGLAAAVEADVLYDGSGWQSEWEARNALDSFRHKGFEFTDTWEWEFQDYTAQYLWCCFAVQWGIAQYDKDS